MSTDTEYGTDGLLLQQAKAVVAAMDGVLDDLLPYNLATIVKFIQKVRQEQDWPLDGFQGQGGQQRSLHLRVLFGQCMDGSA